MQILYGFSNCTNEKYNEIISEKGVAPLQPDQKFHDLLIHGLSSHVSQVKCISGLPINRAVTSRKMISEEDETDNNIHYHYITSLNYPIIRQIMLFFGAFTFALKQKRTEETGALLDCLNIATAYGLIGGCKLKKIPCFAIVTDLPNMFDRNKMYAWVNNFLLRRFDGYVFLTEQMDAVANPCHKPYVITEGFADFFLAEVPDTERYEVTDGKKVIIYAGSIQKQYGIQDLTEGFIQANIPSAELWIYGEGDYREELEKVCQSHPNVLYKGVCSNEEVVFAEQRAALLVNPRPTAPEYTKYSFPSKNMEYMASGTPVMTTNLPGMPTEYHDYVYLIEEESPDGIADTLQKVLSLPVEERLQKGRDSRRFVLEKKSNRVQAQKILDLMRGF